MKTILFSLIAFISSSLTASAQLGKTKSECDKTYGKPVKSVENSTHYSHAGLKVIIRFNQGKGTAMYIECMTLSAKPLTNIQVSKVLKVQGSGKWKKKRNNNSNEKEQASVWTQGEGPALVIAMLTQLESDGGISKLRIMTPEGYGEWQKGVGS